MPASSSSSDSQSLTPLPPPLSLRRSSPSASSQRPSSWCSTSYPEAGTGGGVNEWGVGGFRTSLSLGRASGLGAQAQTTQPTRPDSWSARSFASSHRSMGAATMESVDRSNCPGEPLLHQAPPLTRTISNGLHRKHRHLALWAGVLTLLTFGFSIFYVFEAIVAIVRRGGHGQGKVRWVEAGLGCLVCLLCLVVIFWLQTRRPSPLCILAVCSAFLSIIIHLGLSITNIIIVIMWKAELRSRCSWGIDAAWSLGESGSTCEGASTLTGWGVAAGVRLFVAFVFSLTWVSSLRSFYRFLHRKSHLLSGSTTSARSDTLPVSSDPNHLPAMPIFNPHYVGPSESTTIYANSDLSASAENGGVGVWIASKVWRGIGWMFGVESYESARGDGGLVDVERAEAGRQEMAQREQAMLLRMGRGSESLPGQRLSTGSQPSRTTNTRTILPDQPTAEDESLMADVDSLFARSEANFESTETETLVSPPTSPSATATSSHQNFTGSSGSTGGHMVFVRMGDGKLVRKLSTIASESSLTGTAAESRCGSEVEPSGGASK
ncbi:hypothetical protein T439DRAFT_381795 [Meredithblackwellia eburnea MCA 4105]